MNELIFLNYPFSEVSFIIKGLLFSYLNHRLKMLITFLYQNKKVISFKVIVKRAKLFGEYQEKMSPEAKN